MFFCEYSEIFKNSFFIEYLRWLLLLLMIKLDLNSQDSKCHV